MNLINITNVEKDIEESTSDFHTISLNVAQLNLEDYNRRFNTDFDLVYLKDDRGHFMFKLANPPQNVLEHIIDSDINFFKSWAVNYNYNNNNWFRDFYHNINSLEFEQIMVWRIRDRDMFLDKARSFITKYTDYAPLGFLSEEEIQSVKSEISSRFLRFL